MHYNMLDIEQMLWKGLVISRQRYRNDSSGRGERTKILKSGRNLAEQSDCIRKANIRIIGLQEEERETKEKGQNIFKEIIADSFSNLGRNRIYKSTKLTGHLIIATQKTFPKRHYIKIVKSQ